MIFILSFTAIRKPQDSESWCDPHFPVSVLYPVINWVENPGSYYPDSRHDAHPRGTEEPWADARVQKSPPGNAGTTPFAEWGPKPMCTRKITRGQIARGRWIPLPKTRLIKTSVKNISVPLASLYSLQPESTSVPSGSHSTWLASREHSCSQSSLCTSRAHIPWKKVSSFIDLRSVSACRLYQFSFQVGRCNSSHCYVPNKFLPMRNMKFRILFKYLHRWLLLQ